MLASSKSEGPHDDILSESWVHVTDDDSNNSRVFSALQEDVNLNLSSHASEKGSNSSSRNQSPTTQMIRDALLTSINSSEPAEAGGSFVQMADSTHLIETDNAKRLDETVAVWSLNSSMMESSVSSLNGSQRHGSKNSSVESSISIDESETGSLHNSTMATCISLTESALLGDPSNYMVSLTGIGHSPVQNVVTASPKLTTTTDTPPSSAHTTTNQTIQATTNQTASVATAATVSLVSPLLVNVSAATARVVSHSRRTSISRRLEQLDDGQLRSVLRACATIQSQSSRLSSNTSSRCSSSLSGRYRISRVRRMGRHPLVRAVSDFYMSEKLITLTIGICVGFCISGAVRLDNRISY